MSRENVAVVRSYLEATDSPLKDGWMPTDPREAFAAWWAKFWDPDADYYPIRGFPEAQPRHGRGEIIDFLTDYIAAYERYQYLVKQVRAVGDDRVFAHGHVWAQGRTSGAAVEGDLYHCFWLRHGRFIRAEDHLTARSALSALGLGAEALEAVGLSE